MSMIMSIGSSSAFYESYVDEFSVVTVAELNISHDGKGKLTVSYENGKASSIKFFYQNKYNITEIEKSFDELSRGESIIFKHPWDSSRPAIILEPLESHFKNGDTYNFKLKALSDYNGNYFTTYLVGFYSSSLSPTLFYNNAKFNLIEIKPRINLSKLSWDGSFSDVRFFSKK
jgi:hypothetical protein